MRLRIVVLQAALLSLVPGISAAADLLVTSLVTPSGVADSSIECRAVNFGTDTLKIAIFEQEGTTCELDGNLCHTAFKHQVTCESVGPGEYCRLVDNVTFTKIPISCGFQVFGSPAISNDIRASIDVLDSQGQLMATVPATLTSVAASRRPR